MKMIKIHVYYNSKFSNSFSTNDSDDNPSTINSSRELNVRNKLDKANKNIKRLSLKQSFEQQMTNFETQYPNYRYRTISEYTCLGIICRLLGEVRLLKTILNDEDHPIQEIKKHLTFSNYVNEDSRRNELIILNGFAKNSQTGGKGVITRNTSIIKENEFTKWFYGLEGLLNHVIELLSNPDLEHLAIQELDQLLSTIKQKNTNQFKKVMKQMWSKRNGNGYSFYHLTNLINMLATIKSNKNISGYLQDKYDMNAIQLIYYVGDFILDNLVTDKELINKIYIGKVTETVLKTLPKHIRGNKCIPGITRNGNVMGLGQAFYSGFNGQPKMAYTTPYNVEVNRFMFVPEEQEKIFSSYRLGVIKEDGEIIINIDLPDKELEQDIFDIMSQSHVSTLKIGKKGLGFHRIVKI